MEIRFEQFWDYTWDDIKNEILSLMNIFQEEYVLLENAPHEIKIIHLDSKTDFGFRNSNTLSVSSQQALDGASIKLEATNNLKRKIKDSSAFGPERTINEFAQRIRQSLLGELKVSRGLPTVRSEKLMEIEEEIADGRNGVTLNKQASLGLFGAATGLLILIAGSFVENWSNWVLIPAIGFFVICLVLAIGFWVQMFSNKTRIESLRSKKNLLTGLSDQDDNRKDYYESLLQVNLENLDSYYRMVKIHTAQSFRVSLGLSTVGIVLISVGLILGFRNSGDKATLAYITSSSGILIEIISSLLFFLYNKTVRQLKDYHDSLINAQNIFLSFKLVDSTGDGPEKRALVVKIISSLGGRSKGGSHTMKVKADESP